jgi:hypothetical protein
MLYASYAIVPDDDSSLGSSISACREIACPTRRGGQLQEGIAGPVCGRGVCRGENMGNDPSAVFQCSVAWMGLPLALSRRPNQ